MDNTRSWSKGADWFCACGQLTGWANSGKAVCPSCNYDKKKGETMEIPWPTPLIDNINKSLEAEQEIPRPHMGASQIGHHCERYLWLSFRHAVIPKHAGRLLRIFRRGKEEEKHVLHDLRKAGVSVSNAQDKVDFGCHVAGSCDGIITRGVPEAPNKKHVLEIKTHSSKSFNALVKDGVETSKPQHYIQMQAYMEGLKIDRAMYYAVCKDDDRIYYERVGFVEEVATKYIDRAKRIVLEPRLPEPINADPTWHQCKLCDCYDFCFGSKVTKEANCRTCCHSTPLENSTWRCELHEADDIPFEFQRKGCANHLIHPDLLPWRYVASDKDDCACYEAGELKIYNGPVSATNVFTSKEICAAPDECIKAARTPESAVAIMRESFGGVITGHRPITVDEILDGKLGDAA